MWLGLTITFMRGEVHSSGLSGKNHNCPWMCMRDWCTVFFLVCWDGQYLGSMCLCIFYSSLSKYQGIGQLGRKI
jgi:hypothetical protein